MRLAHDSIRKKISELLHRTDAGALTVDEIYSLLVEPPNTSMGDLAFGCFTLAKQKKAAPPVIAKTISEQILALPDHSKLLESVIPAGPYLNLKFNVELLGEEVVRPAVGGSLFEQVLTAKNPKTMIEFSQPNTHKELHVGHMRNACLGDALVKMHRYSGYEIVSATFPGDVGTHVAKCLWFLKFRNQDPVPKSGKGEWLGQIYSKAYLQLEDEEKTPKGPENQKQLTEILKQLEAKSGEFYELWRETREWSVGLMKSIYQWAGIEFDKWYWESEVDSASVAYAKKLFADGKLVQSQGAIGMDLEADGLGFAMLLKSDGTGLYATKDLELARRKFEENKIEKSIYVVDVRQALHFQQVFKVLEKLGFAQAKECFHLQYNFVELPDGAMSSRKGNIVPLTTLVHRMQDSVKSNFLSRYRGQWQDEEIELVADEVAKGAIKYGMLRMDTNKKIVFEMEEWLKIDGESGPFIQYSHARIRSLLKKIEPAKESVVQWGLLKHRSERDLICKIMNFNTQVLNATELYKPSLICTYLYELAKLFNQFYHDCSIGQAETENLKRTRLELVKATGAVLKNGLALLGIPAPERM